MGDFTEKDLETPRKRKMFWRKCQQILKNKDKRIKLLQQGNRRLKTKIDNLNNLIEDLKEQCNLSANCSYFLKVCSTT